MGSVTRSACHLLTTSWARLDACVRTVGTVSVQSPMDTSVVVAVAVALAQRRPKLFVVVSDFDTRLDGDGSPRYSHKNRIIQQVTSEQSYTRRSMAYSLAYSCTHHHRKLWNSGTLEPNNNLIPPSTPHQPHLTLTPHSRSRSRSSYHPHTSPQSQHNVKHKSTTPPSPLPPTRRAQLESGGNAAVVCCVEPSAAVYAGVCCCAWCFVSAAETEDWRDSGDARGGAGCEVGDVVGESCVV